MKWTITQLEDAVKKSFNWRQVLLHLGLYAGSGNYDRIKMAVVANGFSTDHFDRKIRPETLRQFRPTVNRKTIKRALLNSGVPEQCSICGGRDWYGQKLSLHLDHINGINNDNRHENLRFLCPNCHSLTSTYAGRNAKQTSKAPSLCPCGQTKHRTSQKCMTCVTKWRASQTRIKWPEEAELRQMLETMPMTEVARKLGVSDNAVRKHCSVRGFLTRSERIELSSI